MKSAQMKWWGTIFFDTSRGDRPSLPPPPPRPPLACKYVRPPPATAETDLKSLPWLSFHGIRRCRLAYFFKVKSCYFIANWAKKLADKPFLNKNKETVLSRGSCMHLHFDTGLNVYCCLIGIPDSSFPMPEAPCKSRCAHLYTGGTLSNQCQITSPFWLRNVLFSVIDSKHSVSETHALLCVRYSPWHWRSDFAGGTMGSGSGTWAPVKE